jgi:protein SCO1
MSGQRGVASAAMMVGLLLSAVVASAHGPGNPAAGAPAAARAAGASVNVKLLDLELLDQDGERLRFKTDVVQDRVVIIDTIYTSCPVVCAILSSVLTGVQDRLGARLGQDVLIVSISVDPTTDTPARLKEYARRWKARPGWRFLTGPPRHVDEVLKGLNAYAPSLADHPSVLLVGDPRQRRWRRLYGFPTPDLVLAAVQELSAGRTEGGERSALEPPARVERGR